jgi:hypothetical protein
MSTPQSRVPALHKACMYVCMYVRGCMYVCTYVCVYIIYVCVYVCIALPSGRTAVNGELRMRKEVVVTYIKILSHQLS